MIIDKDELTIQTGGVFRCCLASLKEQIGPMEITETTSLSCKHCDRVFVLSEKTEAHFVPLDTKGDEGREA